MITNIDRKGRIARAMTGVICLILSGVVAAYGWNEGPMIRWTVSGILAVAGLFQLYEAWKGWCVMRALGYRTPM